MVKISIIIPVYNVEKYLSRCLDSVINQTMSELEIICVNDGSTDKSGEILSDYASKDKRLIVINQENQGISVARNKALEFSTGEYVGYIDSDDWVDLDYYEKLYKSAIENNSEIVAAEILRCNDKKASPIIQFDKEQTITDFSEKLRICDVPDSCFVWNKIYKRDFLINSGIKFIPKIIYEDILFTPKIILKSNRLSTVTNTYYHYYRHKNTLVRKQSEKAKQDKQMSQIKLEEFFKEHNIDVSSWTTNIQKTKIFGITVYKTKTKNKKTQHTLLNLIKW